MRSRWVRLVPIRSARPISLENSIYMALSVQSQRSEATVKASTHANPPGLPPDHQETDPKLKIKNGTADLSPDHLASIWAIPKKYDPYLTVKPVNDSDKKQFAELSSGKIWKQLSNLEVKSVGRIDRKTDSLTIQTKTATESDKLLNCKEFCGLPVEIKPHGSLNYSKGVVKNSWLKNSTAEELEKDLEPVIKAEQVIIKKSGKLVKTGTWIFTFSTPICPTRMDVYWMKLPVQVYIPRPMRCFKCQRFGHLTKYCKAKFETCVKCGAPEKHPDCS